MTRDPYKINIKIEFIGDISVEWKNNPLRKHIF